MAKLDDPKFKEEQKKQLQTQVYKAQLLIYKQKIF